MKKCFALIIALAIVASLMIVPSFADGANLVDDPTVTDIANWPFRWGQKCEAGIDESTTHTADGSGSFKIATNEGESACNQHFSAPITVVAGNTYVVSAWVKSDENYNAADVRALVGLNVPRVNAESGYVDPSGNFTGTARLDEAGAHDWTLLSAEVVIDGAALYNEETGETGVENGNEGMTYICVALWGSKGTVWFDDISIADANAATGDAAIAAVAVFTVALAAAVVFSKKRAF